jgi:glycerol-3-phosphate acyltransferase PlsY
MDVLIVILFSYLSGSIPFGLILTKIFTDRDIRNIGSGNIGATNVLRTGNKYLATLTLLLDILKGFIPVIITQQYFSELIQLSCLLAFLGHIFPIWLKFKGGKGVATYLGILFALSFKLGFLFMFTWVLISLIFKYSSLSSMFSSLTVFVVTLIKDTTLQSIESITYVGEEIKLILFIFFILIMFTHKKNILNLKNKTEHKIKI